MSSPDCAHHLPHGKRSRGVEWLDRAAIVLSGLCAIHCVVTPLLIALTPLIASHEFEEWMRLLLASLGVVGVGLGTVLHRNWRAVPALAVGLLILAGLQVSGVHGTWEFAFSMLAAVALVSAHVLNTMACRARSDVPRRELAAD